MNTPPPFEYPAADAREFWVPCDATDEQREEYWCNCCNALADNPQWLGRHLFPYRSFKRHNCGQHWRKKVAVPDGWEVVPENGLLNSGDRYWGCANEWDVMHSAWLSVKEARGEFDTIICFIRRIPATVQPAPKADECDPNQIIALLIAAGFVTAQKVDEARKLLRKA